jgi:tetratricopeptide (TPR) repeat protein
MKHLNSSHDPIKKLLGGLTLILAIPYLILIALYSIGLFIAYAIQKESCPMGFLLLPQSVFPALFIFWLRCYIGLHFIRNAFSLNRFVRYAILLFGVETVFWSWQYLLSRPTYIILSYQAILILSYILIAVIYIRSKKNIITEGINNFYLGIAVIRFMDILQGTVFAILMVPQLFNIKGLWYKDFPLYLNISNTGIDLIIISIIYLSLWTAINIRKFTTKARKVQIAVSIIASINSFMGSLFSTLMPVQLFGVLYLNLPSIKNLFSGGQAIKHKAVSERISKFIIYAISLIMIVALAYQYKWIFGFSRFKQFNYPMEYQTAETTVESAETFNEATNLYFEGKYREAIKVFEESELKKDPSPINKILLAICYGHIGDIEKAKSIGEETIKFYSDDTASHHYMLACYYSIIKEKDKSIEHLKRSIELDKKYRQEAKKDNDFENIKTLPEFENLIKEQ